MAKVPASRTRIAVAVLGVCLLLSAGCMRGPAPKGKGPGHREQPLALSPEQELALGEQAFEEIVAQFRVVHTGPAAEQVRRVGDRIVQAAGIEPLQREINLRVKGWRFEWEYKVLRSDHVNAFCLPGGKIGVFTGLLEVVENDDQLATVLAHEIAHALAHHASERVARERRSGGLLQMAYAREQENEADHIGIFLMTFAGYDPRQAVVFWQRMRQRAQSGLRLPEILSDHPSDERRIAQMSGWVPYARGAKQAYDEGRIAPAR